MEENHNTAQFEEVLEVERWCQSVDYEQVEEVGERVVSHKVLGVKGDTVAQCTHQNSLLEDVSEAEEDESQDELVWLISCTIDKQETRAHETKDECIDCHFLLTLFKCLEEFKQSEPVG